MIAACFNLKFFDIALVISEVIRDTVHRPSVRLCQGRSRVTTIEVSPVCGHSYIQTAEKIISTQGLFQQLALEHSADMGAVPQGFLKSGGKH